MLGKNVYTPTEILEEMKKGTPEGLKHLQIIKKYLERHKNKFEVVSNEECIKWFKKHFFDKRAFRKKPKDILITNLAVLLNDAPDFEIATHWGYYYALWNRDIATEKGHVVAWLEKEEAVKHKVQEAISAHPEITFLSFLGHGNVCVLTGQNYDRILECYDDDSVDIMAGRGGSFLSCLTGRKLAPWLVEQGAIAILAYEDSFYFVIDRANYPNSYAKWFFWAHYAFDQSMYDGLTTGEAYQVSQQKFQEYVESDAVPEECKPYLYHDMTVQKLFGDENWRITEAPSGVKKVELYRMLEGGDWEFLGLMVKKKEYYEKIVRFAQSGKYKLKAIAYDFEDNMAEAETGWFEVKVPPSGIYVKFIYPVGGEHIEDNKVNVKVEAGVR